MIYVKCIADHQYKCAREGSTKANLDARVSFRTRLQGALTYPKPS